MVVLINCQEVYGIILENLPAFEGCANIHDVTVIIEQEGEHSEQAVHQLGRYSTDGKPDFARSTQ